MTESAIASSTSQPKWRVYLLWLVAFCSCLPLLVVYFRSMYRLEQYSYLPLVPIVIGFLIWDRWDRRWSGPIHWGAWLLLVAGISVSIIASIATSPLLAGVSLLLVSAAWFSSHVDRETKRSLLLLFPILLLCVRIPFGIDLVLPTYLQRVTSRLGSFVLDLLSVPHQLEGNVFTLQSGTLFVEEACSGVQSFFAMLFVATAIVTYQRRSLVLLPLYWGVGAFWAASFNIVRIVCVAVGKEWWKLDLAHGWQHETLGYICLLLAILMLLSSDRLIAVVCMVVPNKGKYNPVSNGWNRWIGDVSSPSRRQRSRKLVETTESPFPIAILVPILVVSMGCFAFQGYSAFRTDTGGAMKDGVILRLSPEALNGLDNLLPGSYRQIQGSIDQPMGQNSDVWTVRIGSLDGTMALCQPYPDPHEMCDCYLGQGWELNEREVEKTFEDAPLEWSWNFAKFIKPNGRFGYLLYSTMEEDGTIFDQQSIAWDRIWRRMGSFQWSKASSNRYLVSQLWIESDKSLTLSELEEARRLHYRSRGMFQAELLKQIPKQTP